ncbi:selection and upkeep of intraepithelial T cells 10 [Cricetulus griseus]
MLMQTSLHSLLLRSTGHHTNTNADSTSLDIQINIRVPDAEGILVECTSGSLIPPAEMTWRDSKGNIIPHSSKFDSQDSTGLLYLKSRILLKNRTHGPVTCSIYNETTNQEKKKSIVLPASILDDAYPLYSSWIWDVCIILVVMMTFFTVLILFLLCTLNTREQESQEIEIRPLRHIPHDSTQRRAQLVLGRYREETMQLQGNYEEDNFGQHQEDCEEAIFNALQPLRLDCNLNRET